MTKGGMFVPSHHARFNCAILLPVNGDVLGLKRIVEQATGGNAIVVEQE